MDNETAIDAKIAELDSIFDLVMLQEFLDESLILLKNLLCWTTEDIITLKNNARKNDQKMEMNDEIKQKIEIWNRADTKLYKFFKVRKTQILMLFIFN